MRSKKRFPGRRRMRAVFLFSKELPYLPAVQLGRIGAGVGVVFAERACEVVVAVERGACAEEHVIVSFEIEYGVDGVASRHTDRRRRQAFIYISVIGRRIFQVPVQDAPQSELLQGVFDRRVGLQRPAFAQAVDVDARDAGHFVALAGLLVDDRGERHHFEARQSASRRVAASRSGRIRAASVR